MGCQVEFRISKKGRAKLKALTVIFCFSFFCQISLTVKFDGSRCTNLELTFTVNHNIAQLFTCSLLVFWFYWHIAVIFCFLFMLEQKNAGLFYFSFYFHYFAFLRFFLQWGKQKKEKKNRPNQIYTQRKTEHSSNSQGNNR